MKSISVEIRTADEAETKSRSEIQIFSPEAGSEGVHDFRVRLTHYHPITSPVPPSQSQYEDGVVRAHDISKGDLTLIARAIDELIKKGCT